MLAALLVGVVAFTLMYAYLMTLRLRVGRLEERAAREALSPPSGPTLMARTSATSSPGYVITAVALGGYTLRLFARARDAKRRAEAIAAAPAAEPPEHP